jgi:hypothetical protein
MAATEGAGTEFSIVGAVDMAAKAFAVVGGICLTTGIIYNVSFFLLTRPEWLFHLTVADNLTATLYALPFVLLVLAGVGVYASGPYWFGRLLEDQGSGRRRYFLVLAVLVAAVLYPSMFIFGDAVASAPMLVVILVVALALRLFRTETLGTRLVAYAVAAACILVSCTVLLSVRAHHERSLTADVEIGDRIGSSVIRAKVVRNLDAGMILEQQGAWIWIPKDRILQVKEILPKKQP